MSQKTKFSQEIDIYGYDKRLERTHKLLKRDLSTKNYNFIKKYDQYLTREARAKAYRLKSINTLLTISRILKKDWDQAKKADIENLVTEVMNLYSNQKGQETNTTADCWNEHANSDSGVQIGIHKMPGSTKEERESLESKIIKEKNPPCND